MITDETMDTELEDPKKKQIGTIEEAFHLAEGLGVFQFVSFVVIMNCMLLYSAVIIALPFNLMHPKYDCVDTQTNKQFSCSPKDFCNKPDITHTIDWTD